MQTERSQLTETVTLSGHFLTCVALFAVRHCQLSLHSFALCLFMFLLRYKRRPSFLRYLTTPYQLQEMFSSKQNTIALYAVNRHTLQPNAAGVAYIKVLADIHLSNHEELQSC